MNHTDLPFEFPHSSTEHCPNCETLLDMTGIGAFTDATCPACGHYFKACSRFNQFQITSLLGEGGMGSAFRAMDVNLDREVALKVLKIQVETMHDEAEKLAREARTTAQINHPNVVRIFDFGECRSQFYIAMELVGGGSLDDLMRERGMVPEIMALEAGIQIAQGLKAAMELGLIHRDIKPANILFADKGTVKLVDFGLAVVASDTATSPNEIWGTPYYVAPEKLDEHPEDFRSDIYSLGGTLFHAMAGRPPYEADNSSLVALKQLKSRPVSLQAFAPDVCNETAYVINRMMAKSPDKRYQSYDELIEHLRFALTKANEVHVNPVAARTINLRSLEADTTGMRWINLVFPAIVIFALSAAAFWFAHPYWSAFTARKFLKKSVDDIVAVAKASPERPTTAKETAVAIDNLIKNVRPHLEKAISFDVITKRAIGTGWDQFTPDQQKEAIQRFSTLIISNYTRKFYSSQATKLDFPEILYDDSTSATSNRIEIPATIRFFGSETPVIYRLEKIDGWRVTDFVIDGESLVAKFLSKFDERNFKDRVNKSGRPEAILAEIEKEINSY